jgi:tetratricopeptide (TPR) repeat protein
MFDRVSKIDKAFRRYPEAPLFARLADECLRRGRLRRAQALCEQGCERFPGYPTGFFLLGRCFELQKMWEEARTAMGQGLRLDPDNPSGYRRLAGVYRNLRNDTLALKCLERAALLDPLSGTLSRELEHMSLAVRQLEPNDEETVVPITVARQPSTDPAVSANGPETDEPVTSEPPVLMVPELMVPEPALATIGEPQELPQSSAATDEDLEAPNDGQVVPDGHQDEGNESLVVPADDPMDDVVGLDVDTVIEMPAVKDLAGKNPNGSSDEPFGQVQPRPEWDPPGVLPPSAATAQFMEEPVDDEVAALGAGLFEDDATDPVQESSTTPGFARPAADAVALPETPRVATPQELDPTEAEPIVDLPMANRHEPEPVAPTVEPVVEPVIESAIESGLTAEVGVAQLTGRRGSDLAELLSEFEETPERPAEETEHGQDPGRPVATVTLAEIYAGQGHHEQALEVYQRVLQADPDNETARRGAAELSIT